MRITGNFADACIRLLAGSVIGTQHFTRCTLHDVIEGGWGGNPRIYPYRCHSCGQCFVCAHTQIGYTHWRCPNGEIVPSTPSPGVPAK